MMLFLQLVLEGRLPHLILQAFCLAFILSGHHGLKICLIVHTRYEIDFLLRLNSQQFVVYVEVDPWFNCLKCQSFLSLLNDCHN